jgi:hypothetical protein
MRASSCPALAIRLFSPALALALWPSVALFSSREAIPTVSGDHLASANNPMRRLRQSTGVKTLKIIAKTTPRHLPDSKNQTAAQGTFENRGNGTGSS